MPQKCLSPMVWGKNARVVVHLGAPGALDHKPVLSLDPIILSIKSIIGCLSVFSPGGIDYS